MQLTLTVGDLQRLAQIVREETGNQVLEKNYAMLESRIRSHYLKLGMSTIQEYWAHFERNEKAERSLLQSLMTTHHTFFFREYLHFEMLEKWLSQRAKSFQERFANTKEPVRVWSAACSRGQEVYSLAMFLEFNLLKKYNVPFEIVGTDIDPESVDFARNGVYPIKEVNTIPQMYLSGYWKKGTGPIKDYAAIQPALKSRTHFYVLNLLEINNSKSPYKFDAIFCRNVFIYFSEENVKKIARDLANKLQPEGLLFSGMSEPLRFDGWDLPPVGPSCYQNTTGVRAQSAVPAPSTSAAPASMAKKPIKMPAAAPAASAPVPARPHLSLVPDLPKEQAKYRLLCVDDSPTIQILIKKIFGQDPLCERVDTAGNGKEAREKLNAGKYDLITLDIHMPEVNGIQFLETLYNKKADPPVIMISTVNRTDLELATKSIALGAFDYVEKPAMNNLQKSTDEILTKAKMALRSRSLAETTTSEKSFDQSIAQKIVVPDASQCLRVVIAGNSSKSQLEMVIRGQHQEVRSPPMIVLWKEADSATNVESLILNWTQNQIVSLRDDKQALRPNFVYVIKDATYKAIFAKLRVKCVSIQVLENTLPDLSEFKKLTSLQLLLDEAHDKQLKEIERTSGLTVSDITPATSFPSLSVEFFANIRKAAA